MKSNSTGSVRLLVVRHGVAVEAQEWADGGGKSRTRPLTGPGRRKFRRAAKGIERLVPELDLIVTSPLARANQTAEILAKAYDGVKIATAVALVPGKKPAELLEYLREAGRRCVAVVGHEPDLSTFTSWLLSGLHTSFFDFRKGGACLLEFEGELRPGRAKLLWFARPGQLRRAGR